MRSTRSLQGDERAIEGLPIRLVIALVVGVASLAVMMQILGGIGPVGQTEVTFEHESDAVQTANGAGDTDADINLDNGRVLTKSGEAVPNAKVLIEGKNLDLAQPVQVGETDSNGELSSTSATIDVEFRPDQDKGEVKIVISPPNSGNFKDEESNGDIIVAEDN